MLVVDGVVVDGVVVEGVGVDDGVVLVSGVVVVGVVVVVVGGCCGCRRLLANSLFWRLLVMVLLEREDAGLNLSGKGALEYINESLRSDDYCDSLLAMGLCVIKVGNRHLAISE